MGGGGRWGGNRGRVEERNGEIDGLQLHKHEKSISYFSVNLGRVEKCLIYVGLNSG